MGVFFFNDTATTEIYTLSLHDALPIWRHAALHFVAENHAPLHERGLPVLQRRRPALRRRQAGQSVRPRLRVRDRKSTRLNSSHANISYAVFCLKKKSKYTIYVQFIKYS